MAWDWECKRGQQGEKTTLSVCVCYALVHDRSEDCKWSEKGKELAWRNRTERDRERIWCRRQRTAWRHNGRTNTVESAWRIRRRENEERMKREGGKKTLNLLFKVERGGGRRRVKADSKIWCRGRERERSRKDAGNRGWRNTMEQQWLWMVWCKWCWWRTLLWNSRHDSVNKLRGREESGLA